MTTDTAACLAGTCGCPLTEEQYRKDAADAATPAFMRAVRNVKALRKRGYYPKAALRMAVSELLIELGEAEEDE